MLGQSPIMSDITDVGKYELPSDWPSGGMLIPSLDTTVVEYFACTA